MHIEVIRTGGFAGLRRHAAVDTPGRPDAVRLAALATEALAAGADAPPRGVPDGFHYAITVDGRTTHCADPHLTAAQRALVQALLGEGA